VCAGRRLGRFARAAGFVGFLFGSRSVAFGVKCAAFPTATGCAPRGKCHVRQDAQRCRLRSELWAAIQREERRRQEEHIELIASENYTSPRVLQMQGTVLTNKYAEGYPHKRYYGGCEFVDRAEELAIERAKQLFGADFRQRAAALGLAGQQCRLPRPVPAGDVVLGMSLAHGGHLTHGAKPNFSGKIYKAFQYGLDPATGEVDYAEVERLALEHKPRMIVAGFSAYSRIMDWARFRAIADKVGAYLLVDMAHVAGLVAAGLYPNPVRTPTWSPPPRTRPCAARVAA